MIVLWNACKNYKTWTSYWNQCEIQHSNLVLPCTHVLQNCQLICDNDRKSNNQEKCHKEHMIIFGKRNNAPEENLWVCWKTNQQIPTLFWNIYHKLPPTAGPHSILSPRTWITRTQHMPQYYCTQNNAIALPLVVAYYYRYCQNVDILFFKLLHHRRIWRTPRTNLSVPLTAVFCLWKT